MIRDKQELLAEIHGNPNFLSLYNNWEYQRQQEFLDFCTGARGFKLLYDSFFKEVMNPEYDKSRLERLLCVLLKKKVKILTVLPNDSTRIADESSLLITDIVVELEGGSIANVEIQKIGYAFSGARSACYSSDMLLRQYKRVRSKRGDAFSYQDIKNVYLIVIYENSPSIFHRFPDIYYHHSRQVFDSGLNLDLLQEFIMIPLDIFKKQMHNKTIHTKLEAWLTFLGEDDPEKILILIDKFPEFKAMYQTLYEMCLNTERVMEMFSEELRILDQNTVKYMIEEQQKEIDACREQLNQKDQQLHHKDQQLSLKNEEIARLEAELQEYRKQHQTES